MHGGPQRSSETRKRRRARSWLDPAALMRIKSLELRAKVVMEGFHNGLHVSPDHGFSVEFSEYRPYSESDDPRTVDWRVFARTDRCYVKRFEDETNLRCTVVVDRSRSMGFGSLGYSKDDYARSLAATFVFFLSWQRDAVGLFTFAEDVLDFVPPRYRPGHRHRILLGLESPLTGEGTDLEVPLDRIARTLRKRGMIVILSDFLTPLEGFERDLATLCSRGHEVLLIRVLDPEEIGFGFDRATQFRDLETGQNFFVDPVRTRDDYRRRFEDHARNLETSCSRLGVDFLECSTEEPLEGVLFEFLSLRGKRALRRRPVLRRSLRRSKQGGRTL